MTTLLAAGVFTAPFASANTTAAATIYSQAGDYIGGGQTTTIVDFIVRANYQGGIRLWSPTMYWDISIFPATGQKLAVGEYTNAQNRPTPLNPALDVTGDGTACNKSNGTFWIDDLEWDTNNTPSKIGLRFEQHCEGAIPALYGVASSSGANVKAVVVPKASFPTPPTAAPAPTTAPPTTTTTAPAPTGGTAAASGSAATGAPGLPTDSTPSKKASVGSCVKTSGAKADTVVTAVPCTKPHKAEVVGSWKVAFSGDLAQATGSADSVCAKAFAAYVGSAAYDSKLGLLSIPPNEKNWALGDRSLICLATVRGAGNLPKGTVKGTGQ